MSGPFRQKLICLNAVPNHNNTHVTALRYRKIRSFSESGWQYLCVSTRSAIPPIHPAFLLQTKKLRRIDCNNRYCVWSIAHPQPVNLCQPCYCDKVREDSLCIQSHLGPPKLQSFSNSNPMATPLNPALLTMTQSPFFSVPPALLSLLSFPSPPWTSDNQLTSISYSSSAPTQRRLSLRAHQSTAPIATIGTADLVNSAGASISS